METIYIKKRALSAGGGTSEFTVPAMALQGRDGVRLIPHPYGPETATFPSIDETIGQVHRAGYAAEFEGKHYPLPDQAAPSRMKILPKKSASRDPISLVLQEALPLLESQLRDTHPAVIAGAAMALGELRDPVAIDGLIAALNHEDAQVRKCAAEALAKIGPPAFQNLQASLKDKRWLVRHSALHAVQEAVRQKAPWIVQMLPGVLPLLQDENPLVRTQAAAVFAGLAKHLPDQDAGTFG